MIQNILKYVKEKKLEINQELLEAELLDDGDILDYIVSVIDNEIISLHRVKKQNITNAFELSIKNKLPEVTEKITKINQIDSKNEVDI